MHSSTCNKYFVLVLIVFVILVFYIDKQSDQIFIDFPKTGFVYMLKEDESLRGIALRNNSRVSWIMKANQIRDPNYLKKGYEIFVPVLE